MGRGYRNEISPRQGMIRLREFNMMECELFVDPEDKTWPRFGDVAGDAIRLLTNDGQEMEVTVSDAVEKECDLQSGPRVFHVVHPEFLKAVGIDGEKLGSVSMRRTRWRTTPWTAGTRNAFSATAGPGDRRNRRPRLLGPVPGMPPSRAWEMSSFKRFDEPQEIERTKINRSMTSWGRCTRSKAGKIRKGHGRGGRRTSSTAPSRSRWTASASRYRATASMSSK